MIRSAYCLSLSAGTIPVLMFSAADRMTVKGVRSSWVTDARSSLSLLWSLRSLPCCTTRKEKENSIPMSRSVAPSQ
jgi:hypothetical protein